MNKKALAILYGSLVCPLRVGRRALILCQGQLIRTSRVVAIRCDTSEEARFETLDTRYTLILKPAPKPAAIPVAPLPFAA